MLSKKGFTLIELMIVIAIIAIIAAIAIPNLMQSRIRANEATAVTALKNYCSAQVTFQVGKMGRAAANTPGTGGATSYCTNYRNLFYGNPIGAANAADTSRNLTLISLAHADAFIDTGYLIGTTNNAPLTAPGTATPYQGYQFGNPQDAEVDADFFDTNFGQIGAPSTSGTTGNNVYWVGIEGTVYMQGLDSGDDAKTSTGSLATPSKGGSAAYTNWFSL